MFHPPRFYIGRPLTAAGEYTLDAEESRHAAGVLRLRAGDRVEVFDGLGVSARAVILEAAAEMRLRTGEPEPQPPPLPRVGVATAIPKGKRWRVLVEKCTELGVDRIVPLLSERSVARGEGDVSRWRRWSIEASKQCFRSHLPEISAPMAFFDFLENGISRDTVLILADRGGETPAFLTGRIAGGSEAFFLIGPEGGFIDAETAAARSAGASVVRLSPFRLRVETAAMAAVAMIRGLSG
ncbi:MAG: 16S rRNA (uracil(1498)-N(3))-methyltransferase [Planctomycetota bacterium]|jgi:16S rRNA (uracil1498-N3)-methyltransferase|nr:16S rRNA (uracil(1498)-N(3))-methyltransferase [Planctomycetota bacterium]